MLPVGRHPITNSDVGDAYAHGHHLAHMAITERQRLIEFPKNGLQRRHQPIRLDFLDHLLHLIGLLPGFAQQIRLAKIDQHPLSPQRHQRTLGTYQHLPGPYLRGRHRFQHRLPGL